MKANPGSNRPDLSPLQLAQGQLDAYNERDVRKFVTFFSEDIQTFTFESSQPSLSGMEKFRTFYEEAFAASPTLHCKLLNRITQGQYIVDQEEVTGLRDKPVVYATAIYGIKDGLISKVWFIR